MNREQLTMGNEQGLPMTTRKAVKRHSLFPLFSLLIINCSLLICSCSSPSSSPSGFTQDVPLELPEGFGAFTLRVENIQRTILPNVPDTGDFKVFKLSFAATTGGEAKDPVSFTNYNAPPTIILAVGTYDITLEAYLGGTTATPEKLAARGTLEDIVISNSTNTTKTITLKGLGNEGDGNGTFTWNVNITAAGVTSATMTIMQGNSHKGDSPITLNPSGVNTDSKTLSSGVYNVSFTLEKEEGGIKQKAVWNEILYIYAELTSPFPKTSSKVFDDDFFYQTHYDITYIYNYKDGNSPPDNVQSVDHGTTTLITNPTRTGFSFGGWYKDPACAEADKWDPATDPVIADIDLYARWYSTVTYNINGATTGTAPAAETPDEGESVTLPTNTAADSSVIFSRGNYTFGGWAANASGSGTVYDAGDPYISTGNITLYARWYSIVTFDANDATDGTAPTSMEADLGSPIILPGEGDLERFGYKFGGWNTLALDTGLGTNRLAGASYTPNGNIILYARWCRTITYDTNGGGGTVPTDQEVNAGGSVTLRSYTGTLANHALEGWNTKDDRSGDNYKAGTSYTDSELPDGDTITLYAEWVFTSSPDNPFEVYDETDLRKVGTGTGYTNTNSDDPYRHWTLTAHYKQMDDITLTDQDPVTPDSSNPAPWTRIGTGSGTSSFTGSYNGDGFTITGLTINATTQYQGMFGYIGTGGKVKDLSLTGVAITSASNTGGIAGYNNGGTIENCSVTGSVEGTNYTGGIAGYNTGSGTIQNCSVTGITASVKGTSNTGGIAGYNTSSNIQNCHVTASVVSTTGITGGIVGTIASGTIQKCYVTGSVTVASLSASNGVGGIAGAASGGTIQDCYVTGNVTAETLGSLSSGAGGIVGYHSSGTIQNCYVTGSVSGNTASTTTYAVGGIVGYHNNGTIRNCVALNKSVTSKSTAATPNIGRISGTTTGTRANNYAWSGMELTADSKPISPSYDANSRDGTGIRAENNSQSFLDLKIAKDSALWTTPANWNATAPGEWDFSTVWEWDGTNMPSLIGVGTAQPWPSWLKDGDGGITLTVAAITNLDPTGLPNNITFSRSGAGGHAVYQHFTIDLDDYDPGSVRWEIFGAGRQDNWWFDDVNAFTINATNESYNSLGAHTLRLTVKIEGVPYMVNIAFTIVE